MYKYHFQRNLHVYRRVPTISKICNGAYSHSLISLITITPTYGA